MNRLHSLTHRFRRNEDGAIMIFVAIALTMVLAATGMAFEMSNYTKAKSRFNNALDQALLAAAASDPADINEYARRYFMSNMAEEGLNATVTSFSVTSNSAKTEWEAKATGVAETTFSKFLGVDTLEMSHSATVEWDASTTTELVAMVDVSGTMCANFERIQQQDGSTVVDFVPDRNCTKINQMKEALKQIVTIGIGYTHASTSPPYKVGLVPFTYKVKVPEPANLPEFMLAGEKAGGFGDNYFMDVSDAEQGGPPLPTVTPLMGIANSSDKESFLKKVAALSTNDNQEFSRPFMKRSSLGALTSAIMLDPQYNSAFRGEKPAEFGAPNSEKIVIMMTDSANLGCCFTNWPETNFRNHYIYSYKSDHDALLRDDGETSICKAMKDKGIKVYTVLLDVNRADMDARGNEIIDAFKDCASSPDYAFEVPRNDEAKLKEAYTQIGKSLVKLRLTK